MKSALKGMLWVGMLVMMPAFAQTVKVDAPISAVTVYSDRAIITRELVVPVSDPKNTITISFLPTMLDFNSLQFSYQLNNSTKSSEAMVELRDHRLEEMPKRYFEELIKIKASLSELEKKEQEHQIQIEAVEQKISWSKAYLNASNTVVSGVPRVTESDLVLIARLQSELPALELALLEVKEAQRQFLLRSELEKESLLKALEIQEQKLANLNQQLSMDFVTQEAGNLHVSVSYVVPGPSWSATYTLALAEENIEFSYLAYVTQNTWEDWDNVPITLSTTPPALSPPYPLAPRILDIQSKDNFQSILYASKQMAPLMESQMLEQGVELDQAQEQEKGKKVYSPQVSQQGVNLKFDLASEATVLGDGTTARLFIQSFKLPAKMQRELRSEQSETVALYALMTNETPVPWLAGNASIFIEDQMIATEFLPQTAVGEPLKLYVGRDPNIKVKRSADKLFKETGFRKNIQTQEFSLSVVSYYDKPIDLAIYERVPVSGNDEVKVEYVTLSSDFVPFKDSDPIWQMNQEQEPSAKQSIEKGLKETQGVLKATVQLAPKETRSFDFKHRVTYPLDKTVVISSY